MNRSRKSLLAMILLVGGCTSQDHSEVREAGPGDPARVRVAPIQRRQHSNRIPLVGTVRADTSVVVSARVMGYIRTIDVEEGDRVRAGQRLITLEDAEMLASLGAAQADANASLGAIVAAGHAIESARARLELTEQTLQRFQDLLDKKSATQHEYDRALAGARQARADVASAESQREQAVARQAQAQAHVTSARTTLSYTRIHSPVSGVVVRRDEDAGSLAVPGRPILSLEKSDGYQLHLTVPESLLERLQVGQLLPIEIDALHAQGPSEGRIQEIVPVVDVRSRTSVVKVDLPSLPALRSGLYGRAFLEGKSRSVLVVPRESIREEGQIRSVFVVDDGIARQRLITLGAKLNGAHEALSGVVEGERIVLAPGDLRDGTRVVSSEGSTGETGSEKIDSLHKENPDG